MKLEVGQFARLKSGYIVKVLNVKDNWIETDTKFITRTFPKDFVKASYNIIDLIEVGDYVNGEKVIRVIPQDICGDEVLDYQHIFVNDKEVFKDDIKSIVTKEMFANAEYKVETN